jgi:hypothetical protein
MATIDIGKLTFTHKGDYAGGTAYVANDVVYYNGSAYVAKTSTTGNLPTSTAHWNTFAAGSGGIWNAGLSLGTAGQIVKVNSGGNALEFGADEGGKILQVQNMITQSSSASTSSSYVVTALTDTITPSATSSKILVLASGNLNNTGSGYWSYATIFRDGSNIAIDNDGFNGIYSAGGDTHTPFNLHYLDSPNSTSSLTYDIRIRCSGNTVRFNHEQNTSSLTLIEIGA